jgi:hypothetical protein
MTNFKIPLDTEHDNTELKWRVIIGDREHPVKNIFINCSCKTAEDSFVVQDSLITKRYITCESDDWYINENNVLTIN